MIYNFKTRMQPFLNVHSWAMVIVGLAIFSLRIEFEPGGWVNLPVAFTILQTAALMFSVFGLQSMASMAVWPQIRIDDAIDQIARGNTAAGQAILGLLIFNGLSVFAFVMWLTSAIGAGIRAS